MKEREQRRQAGGRGMLCREGRRRQGCPWHGAPSPGVGSMPVGRRRSPRLRRGPGERWARLRRAPRLVPTLLCAGLGLRGPSVDLLSRPPGWLGGNPWGKGAGQRVSASREEGPPGMGAGGGTPRAGVTGAHGAAELRSPRRCWQGSADAAGWAGLQQELLQDGSCSLPQNRGAPVRGRRERSGGCTLEPSRWASCPGTQRRHVPPSWQRPMEKSNVPAPSHGTGGATGTVGVSGTPCPCHTTTSSAREDTRWCPQYHWHPWSSDAATAQSGSKPVPIQSQSDPNPEWSEQHTPLSVPMPGMGSTEADARPPRPASCSSLGSGW